MEKRYVELFRAAPFMLMLDLRKDALFHSQLPFGLKSRHQALYVNSPSKITF
jgi:hypothetical protein